MDTTITPTDRAELLGQMRRAWVNTAEQTRLEMKIQAELRRQLGRDTSAMERQLEDRLRDCMVALAVIDQELATKEESR